MLCMFLLKRTVFKLNFPPLIQEKYKQYVFSSLISTAGNKQVSKGATKRRAKAFALVIQQPLVLISLTFQIRNWPVLIIFFRLLLRKNTVGVKRIYALYQLINDSFAEPPSHPPVISVGREPLDYGDILRANCSSYQSRPPASLKFILNNNTVICIPLLI